MLHERQAELVRARVERARDADALLARTSVASGVALESVLNQVEKKCATDQIR